MMQNSSARWLQADNHVLASEFGWQQQQCRTVAAEFPAAGVAVHDFGHPFKVGEA
jgi:hypothetical protein